MLLTIFTNGVKQYCIIAVHHSITPENQPVLYLPKNHNPLRENPKAIPGWIIRRLCDGWNYLTILKRIYVTLFLEQAQALHALVHSRWNLFHTYLR